MPDENNKAVHLHCLDGLKGIGAFIVAFIWHYQHFSPNHGNPFGNIFKLSYVFGWSMVDVFFMLSGFGMMLGYGYKIYNKQISFKAFFIRRFKRLYPLFILTTALVFFLELVYKHRTGETFIYSNFDVYHVVQNVLVLQYGILGQEFSLNAPSWCIPICLTCYCFFYFIIYRIKEYHHCIYFFSVTAIIGAALIASGWGFPIINYAIGRGMASFSIGVLLSYIYEKREYFKSLKLGYCCLGIISVIYLVLRFKTVENAGDFTLLMTLGVGPMIIMSVLFVPWINAILGSFIFRQIGLLSLEIYLLHFPIQCTIKIFELYFGLELDYSDNMVWIMYVVVTIAISLIYNLFFAKRNSEFVCDFFKKS